ncbi:MAG: hypothetical protein ACTHOK_06070 [Nocardioidaceae bacterium]
MTTLHVPGGEGPHHLMIDGDHVVKVAVHDAAGAFEFRPERRPPAGTLEPLDVGIHVRMRTVVSESSTGWACPQRSAGGCLGAEHGEQGQAVGGLGVGFGGVDHDAQIAAGDGQDVAVQCQRYSAGIEGRTADGGVLGAAETTVDLMETLFETNTVGVVRVTHAFPGRPRRPDGRVLRRRRTPALVEALPRNDVCASFWSRCDVALDYGLGSFTGR